MFLKLPFAVTFSALYIFIYIYNLGLEETVDRPKIAYGVRWYRHVVRKDKNNILRVKGTGKAIDQREPDNNQWWNCVEGLG